MAEKDDLMGAEDSQKKGFFSTKTTFKNRSTIFTLGSRDTVLTTELEDPIIIIPQAQKAEKKVRREDLQNCHSTPFPLPLPPTPPSLTVSI